MQMTMRRYAAALLAVFALCLAVMLPQQASAAAGDATATVELEAVDGAPNEAEVYLTTNQVDARSFNLVLAVKTDTPGYVTAAFLWDAAIAGEEGSASFVWDEPTEEADGLRLSLYAGDLADEPFKSAGRAAEGQRVHLGTLVLAATDTAPADTTVSATASVEPGNAAVRFAAYRSAEQVVPEPTMVPQDGVGLTVTASAQEGGDQGEGGADGKDPAKLNTPKQLTSILGETPETNGKNLPNTGDQMMPLVITLACVAVLAVAVIVVMMVRRKKTGADSADKQ